MLCKRPQTIPTLLTKYKIQAHEDGVANGWSHPCGKCLLTNQGGEGGIVKKKQFNKSKNGKMIKLKKILNYKNFGICTQKAMSVMSTM